MGDSINLLLKLYFRLLFCNYEVYKIASLGVDQEYCLVCPLVGNA